ncbi:hypothetical protein ABBQ32_000533 [Trebouxia sp. C0010 RCD-2024]
MRTKRGARIMGHDRRRPTVRAPGHNQAYSSQNRAAEDAASLHRLRDLAGQFRPSTVNAAAAGPQGSAQPFARLVSHVGSNNLHVHEEADADTAKSKLQLLQTIFEETSHKRKSPSGRVRLGSKKSPKSSAGVVKTSPTTKVQRQLPAELLGAYVQENHVGCPDLIDLTGNSDVEEVHERGTADNVTLSHAAAADVIDLIEDHVGEAEHAQASAAVPPLHTPGNSSDQPRNGKLSADTHGDSRDSSRDNYITSAVQTMQQSLESDMETAQTLHADMPPSTMHAPPVTHIVTPPAAAAEVPQLLTPPTVMLHTYARTDAANSPLQQHCAAVSSAVTCHTEIALKQQINSGAKRKQEREDEVYLAKRRQLDDSVRRAQLAARHRPSAISGRPTLWHEGAYVSACLKEGLYYGSAQERAQLFPGVQPQQPGTSQPAAPAAAADAAMGRAALATAGAVAGATGSGETLRAALAAGQMGATLGTCDGLFR